MNKIDQMNELIEKLNYYTKLYDEGHPAISDKEWDNMYFKLEQLEQETGIILSNSPTAKIDYQIVNKLNKVEHNHPMLSLDKTKSEDEIINFLDNKDSIIMAKMDGLTCSIRYLDGKLFSAETRGNGVVGEDITHNIKFVKGVPLEIPSKKEFIIDGEVICSYENFEEFADEYKNPRNFASGSIRLLDSKASAHRKLTFVAWDCIKGLDEYQTLSEKIMQLDGLGFIIVPFLYLPSAIIDQSHIHHALMLIQEMAKELSYPIDGAVFKYDNCEYYQSLGYTGHHFRGGLAFKFYDDEYPTELLNIEWSMGKTGQLTPVALFEPVDDGESVVTRASLHNLNIMEQLLGLNPHFRQKIWVSKMNQIIPQVVRSEHGNEGTVYYLDKKVFVYPNECPICGSKTVIRDDFLYCDNPNCEGKFINQLVHFCGKKGLDIKGLSEATLQKLVDWGWVGNYQELFSLSNFRDQWVQKPGFGEKSVDKLLEVINEARDCELWQFISALSIPLIGSTYAKQIAKRFEDWSQFIDYISQSDCDFLHWEGFGYEMNRALKHFNYSEANDMINNGVIHLKNNLYVTPEKMKLKNANLDGKVFVITGKLTSFKNRDEAKEKIESNGGKVVDSVSKKTSYLINNDINSTSSKNVKAKQLGIPIITEEQLIAML